MKYGRERLTDTLIKELEPLLLAHWHEVAHFLDIPLDVDWTRYGELDLGGKLRLFTVRDDETLVGYAAYIVNHNLHYSGSLQAVQDVLFLVPEHRRAWAGSRLINFCDEQLRREGVQVVYQHSKDAHSIGPLLERLGYERVESIYARRLDK